MANPQQAAQGIATANKAQTSQALILQTYANSVKQQPEVDLSSDPKLESFQTQINSGLTTAQGHASNYLSNIQPKIIQNISNIGNFYALNNAVPTTLPAGSTAQAWLESLSTLQSQATQYQGDATDVASLLQNLSDDLNSDTQSFSQTVTALNTAVNGDNGVLASENQALSTVQGELDGAIAQAAVSGLAIVGGGFMIAVGAIADFVTAGTSTPLVLAGVGVLATGIGGETDAALRMKTLYDRKALLLTQEAELTAEVNLALGISNGYQSLLNQVQIAVDAANQMQDAWQFLSTDLGSMISDLQNGIQSADQIRTLFLTAANNEAQTVLTDINTIKAQMAGIQSIVAPPGQTIGEALVAAASTPAALIS